MVGNNGRAVGGVLAGSGLGHACSLSDTANLNCKTWDYKNYDAVFAGDRFETWSIVLVF